MRYFKSRWNPRSALGGDRVAGVPGERLIACYNPLLAEKRRRKREQLLAATEEILAKLARAVSLRTKKPLSSAEIGVKAGRVIGRHKMAKHIRLTIHDGIFTWSCDEDSIKREGMLDGIYVVRTSEPAERLSAPASVRVVQAAIAGGAVVPLPEGDRPAGAADLPSDRAPSACPCLDLRTGVLRGMAPASGLAITLFEDEELDRDREERDPVAPARPSASVRRKKKTHQTAGDLPVHSFQTLLVHLGGRRRETHQVSRSQKVL